MLRLLILLFLHVSLIFAIENTQILQRADKLLKSSSKSEIFRAYNDYKNVYVRSMVKSDLITRKRALEGIVKSGEKLHIDVSAYKKELSKLKKSLHKSGVLKKESRKEKKSRVLPDTRKNRSSG